MEGLFQAFAKEIAVATVGGLISTFLFARASPVLRAVMASMVAITLAGATYYFFTRPGEEEQRRCETAWETAQTGTAIGDYLGFVEGCPNSVHAGAARAQIRSLCEANLDRAQRQSNIEALDSVGHDCRDTPVAAQAQHSSCQIRWQRASRENSIEGYAHFEQACPQSEFPVAQRTCGVRWREAVQRDSVGAYQEFQAQCNDSAEPGELQRRACSARWRDATARHDLAAYREFLGACENAIDAPQATASILALCEHQWSQANASEDVRAYQAFTQSCPESRFHAEANEQIENLCHRRWNRTERADTVEEFRAFVSACPNTRHSDEAQYQVVRGSADKITRNYALTYQGCQIYVRPNLSPERQQDAINDATNDCRRRAERERRGPGPSVTETILAVIVGVCAAGGC